MAYINIILLAASFFGILYGLFLLFRAHRFVFAVLFSLLSVIVLEIIATQFFGNLRFIGIDGRFLIEHSFRSTPMCLGHHTYGRLIWIDLVSVIYASFLVVFGRWSLRARELKRHTGSRA